ncbi:DUF3429 domain-containing protein [Roseovarius sp. SCSIO 43702]|uniref:DUF3429 domain-containing protein n=1 Tax=Roseovarius sp. SCSIO 43702 TaxID=2823043 RepID=UPI001C73945C|nr:DUF3429 domain-containing protein [Roseovarius sp. SCSIO 43702]QYX58263.1 DUF3429 domain-containing protein [Roseovarius sp. SCSIO 43702]
MTPDPTPPATTLPRAPLLLGLAGLLPFLWGVATLYSEPLGNWTTATIGPRFVGPYVALFYGAVILSFMSGVLWGFATRLDGRRAVLGYGLSVLPALWVFFTTGGGPDRAGLALMVGFLAILPLDWLFARWGAAPNWWMPLRLLLTGVVLACLFVTITA